MTQMIRFPLELARPAASNADRSGPAVRLALQPARQLVRDGDGTAARIVCAAVISTHQPVLAQNAELLLDTVTVLAAARGFRAIERLIAATESRSVRISAAPARAVDPGARSAMAGSVERVTISEACLEDPWMLRHWCEQLLAGPGASPA